MKTIFLVDGDNNIGTGLKGIDMLSEQDAVLVFYQKTGLALSRLQKLCADTKAEVQYIESIRGGKNSIDFQIITELGVLVGKGEADYAYVISQDKGYEASIEALRARYGTAFREVALRPSIEDCLRLPFVRRAADRGELCNALVKEYGAVQGNALYNHLKEIFQGPEPAAEPERPAKSSRNLKRKRHGCSMPLFFCRGAWVKTTIRQKTTFFDKLLVFHGGFCYAIGVAARVFHG